MTPAAPAETPRLSQEASSLASAYATLSGLAGPAAAQPRDEAILRQLVPCYVRIGLKCAANEALDALSAAGSEDDWLAALRREAASLPNEVEALDQSHITERFEANLAVLIARFDRLRPHERSIVEAARRVTLHRACDGNVHASRRVGEGPRRWLRPLADWRGLAQRAALLPPAGSHFCAPLVLDGLGLGEVLDLVFAGTQKMFLTFRPRVHAVEMQPAMVAAWLMSADRRDLLRDERFHLWLGPDAAAELGRYYETNVDLAEPRQVIRIGRREGATGPSVEEVIARISDAREREAEAMRTRIRERAAARGGRRHCAERFRLRGGGALRVLGITSRFTTFLQHSMRDIGDALGDLGHAFELIIERDDHTHGMTPVQFLRSVERFDPDLILVIDHNRYEYGATLDLPILFCDWIQDELPHLFNPGSGAQTRPDDLIVGTISGRSARAAGYPVEQVRYLPVPVNPRVYSAEPIGEVTRRRYACEMSFVSNLSITADAFLEQVRAAHRAPELIETLHALREELEPRIAAGGVPATTVQTEGLIQQVALRLGYAISDATVTRIRREFGDRLINICYRHQPLVWAAEMGVDLHLYGRGWETHPTLARFARGVAANGDELRAIFQASRVNLQLYPLAGIHQRLLEGLCSGGFFLIRGTPADDVADDYVRLARLAVERDLRTEAALAACDDPEVRALTSRIAEFCTHPRPLYDGFAEQLHDFVSWAWKLDMSSALPRYRDVRFATQNEFRELVSRFLSADSAAKAIASEQRAFVLEHMTYRAAVSQLLDFAAERAEKLAAASENCAS